MFGWSVTITNTVQPRSVTVTNPYQPRKKQITKEKISIWLYPNGKGSSSATDFPFATHYFVQPETIVLQTNKLSKNEKAALSLPWNVGTSSQTVNNVTNGSSWKIITVDDTTNGGYPGLNGSWKLVPAK